MWNDGGRNKYLVGTLKGRNAVANEVTFRYDVVILSIIILSSFYYIY